MFNVEKQWALGMLVSICYTANYSASPKEGIQRALFPCVEESTVGCLGSEAIVWFLLLKTPEAMLPSLRCILATLRSH